MSRTLTLLAVVLMGTTPLIGCIGNDDGGLDQSNLTDTDDTVEAATGAVAVHTAGTANATSRLLDADALPDGVPMPKGLQRLTGFANFEPTIGVTSDGTLFMSNIQGGDLPTQLSTIIRSTDQGQSWQDVTPGLDPTGTVSAPPNSNDPYVYVDEATDRVYNLDMQGLACNWVKWSDDNGESWTHSPISCGQPPVLDHPTIFAGPPNTAPTVGYENVVYLCVNRVADSACATSLDGGMTWAGFVPVYPGVNTAGEMCGGLHAHGVVGPDGTAYLPKGQCGTPMVAMSQDDGLTWETVAISDSVPIPGHEVAFDVDQAGNAYALWMSDDDLPYLAISTDGGQSWGEPMMVAPPDLTITRFPTLAAGDDGQIAVAYIGTSTDKDQSEMEGNDTWNAYITTTTDALANEPVFATVSVNEPSDPIARGPCSGRCGAPQGGGNIGDFIDIVIDQDGRPWAAYADICTTEACINGTENDVGEGLLGTLTQGPALRSNATALPPLSQAGPAEADDGGDGIGDLLEG